MSTASDAFREHARQAVEAWDGQSTAALVLDICRRTGECVDDVIEAVFRLDPPPGYGPGETPDKRGG